jgi:hypothetical protein
MRKRAMKIMPIMPNGKNQITQTSMVDFTLIIITVSQPIRCLGNDRMRYRLLNNHQKKRRRKFLVEDNLSLSMISPSN